MTVSAPEPAPTVLNAGVIASSGMLAQVGVLLASFRAHHPRGSLTVLLVDDPAGAPDPASALDGAVILGPTEIGLDPTLLRRMRLAYAPAELRAAVRPWLLRTLLDGPHDHAVLLDPAVDFHRELVELPDLVRRGSVLLTPHATEPMPRDGLEPSEEDLLLRGAFDPGFLAVGDDDNARRMLAWWQGRMHTDADDDRAHGRYLGQRWLDLVPGLFDHLVVRDPSWNLASWNLATRPLSRGADGEVLVGGRALAFMQFAGYSPRAPHLLSAHQTGSPRVRLSSDDLVRELCDDYAARLIAAGHVAPLPDHATPYLRVDGLQIDPVMRRLLRSELRAQDIGRGTGLDIDGGIGSVRAWLLAPVEDAGMAAALGRYLGALWEARPDLHAVFPEVPLGDPRGFLDWCELFGLDEMGLARWPLEDLRGRLAPSSGAGGEAGASAPPLEIVSGVEVVGFLTADLGLGQAARMLVAGLESAGVAVSTSTYTRTSSRLGTPWADRPEPEGVRHDVAVVCINADMLPTYLHQDGGAAFLEGRYVVGLWFWELDDFPERFRPALAALDEVWVTSEFTAEVLRAVTPAPVRILPLPVHAPSDTGVRLPELADEDTFTFLFVFDYFSVMERKNPHGLIEAYVRAFPAPGEARLVIKTVNADKRVAEQERLRYACRGRPDIVLVERYLSRGELDGLMWAADCYVSLHRSEGFGLTMAEAMATGTPVVATGYSGNLAFMTRQNSRLVDYSLVAVPPGCDPYPETSRWARPKLGQAARMMRRIHADATLRDRLGRRAAADIAERHSVAALAAFAVRRLEEIRAARAFPPTPGHGGRGRVVAGARRLAGRRFARPAP